jgi:hypothetical protein
MTHKEIVRNATNGNVVDFMQYRMDRRMDVGISPPANARQVFAPKPKRFKTDKQRVAECNRPSSW